ncbi:MAG: TraR/DksA family transcriptional regulator [Lewinellaceae bacterium]|nr:TraR/DksA family transcriptional regulator [Lewinellaceae bacterium]
MMKVEETRLYQEKLKAEIVKVEAFIQELKAATQPEVPDSAIGRISRMDAINNKSVVENSLRENQQKLTQLKTILSKFGSVDFGRCTRCGGEIQFARLMFMPNSMRCMRCSGGV